MTQQNYQRFLVTVLFFFLITTPLLAQLKGKHSLGVSGGLYSAEGLGTNGYGKIKYNHYLDGGKHFFEAGVGVGSIKSMVLKTVANAQLFKNERLMVYELSYGYHPRMWSSLPYFLIGVASIDQGGQSKFSYVLGLGNRISLGNLSSQSSWGVRYDVRDHIFEQSFNGNSPFLTNNFVFTVTVELFY